MAGYKGKYLKTYFWSGLSLLLSFLSMFIVAPLTTSMPEAYGVYSLCISFRIFLQYADLGFITAGRKYAAEAFIINDFTGEKKYVGTSMFIYGVMVLLLFSIALFFSRCPEFIIKDIEKGNYYGMAQQLLLILAITIPLSIIPKFCSVIYAVRIEEYKIQRFQIIGSLIKITSVPVYFFNGRYDIVGYFLFCEIINLLVGLITLFYSKKIGYGFKEIFSCISLDKATFKEIMPLALGGFAATIGWVFYYELDTLGVSALLGANAVAIYAVGKQIQTFIRSIVAIVFSPYPTRINYFIGQNDIDGLKKFFYHISETLSFIIIPIVTIVLFAKPLVVAWVGDGYMDSCIIVQLLVLTFIFNHVTSQSSSVIYGLNKVKDLLVLSFIKPILFWICILITYKLWGVNSFAIFQLGACVIGEMYLLYLTRKYLRYTKFEIYGKLLIKPLVVISLACWGGAYVAQPFLKDVSKGHQDLLEVALVMSLCCLIAFGVDLRFNKSLRKEIYIMCSNIKTKFVG